ncbi:MAG: hypothetical protein J0L77_09435 [Alphaproteobacteria bacterium]|nr:hypothetical protein [Alphaproteobacteria bacterium]
MKTAKAVGYNGVVPSLSGASEPLMIVVRAEADGELFDVYAKLSDKLHTGIKGYTAEAIASLLAADLGLHTPQSFAVTIDDNFIASVADVNIRKRLESSARVVFATQALPPSAKVPTTDMPLTACQLRSAGNIFAFDALIENYDRGGAGKANCLLNGDIISIIDHEKAFPMAMGLLILGRKNPWEVGALEKYRTSGSHLFINQILKNSSKIDMSEFSSLWANLTDERILEYGNCLPSQWANDNNSCVVLILQHIIDVRNNINDCITEIKRIIGKA